ncbi:MAG: 3-deoxy-manno-octulosonate cytidylyltransferase [Rickettsiales bacterium]|jgi:3-deoxy-manno-octulosonate cytidylyltransferase (CMP-KDO synthetase)|nr:3-deoxy-manno-octulosonate cytidylyltransferase [Rickettsiales bacterium]
MTRVVIVIPARYASTRFPGKPLVNIRGKPMLRRTYDVARIASDEMDCRVIVATEDERIMNFCAAENIECMMTSSTCKTGTDRVYEVVRNLEYRPEFIVNLQGDAPLTPPWFIARMVEKFFEIKDRDNHILLTVGSPVGWRELDSLREGKEITPFSGTTLVINHRTSEALWFSKNIIPAIAGESRLREIDKFSPVIMHIGLYGYSYDMLMKFANLEEGHYEKIENLEQLRALENGYKINVVIVGRGERPNSFGVDTPEDIERAEALIDEFGEFQEREEKF